MFAFHAMCDIHTFAINKRKVKSEETTLSYFVVQPITANTETVMKERMNIHKRYRAKH
jgi:hypothetical protein